jgi:cytoskeleton protein RodZ
MASVGAYLRELREQRGLSLEEIARATRVASRYLQSVEADDFSDLPAPAFTRGFIRAYCQALGEPPESALALYEQRDGRVPPAPATGAASRTATSRTADGEPRTRGAVLVSFVLLVVLGMALFAVTLMIQPQRDERVERRPPMVAAPNVESPSPVPAAPTPPPAATPSVPLGPPRPAGLPAPAGSPAITGTAPASPATPPPAGAARPTPPTGTSSAAPTASTGSPTAPPSPAGAASTGSSAAGGDLQAALASVSSPYHLIARTSEPTWIRVRTDDGRMTEETVPAGQVREWVSNRPLVLTIGNAGGVSFELNGRKLPALGGSGAVIQRIVLPPEGQ